MNSTSKDSTNAHIVFVILLFNLLSVAKNFSRTRINFFVLFLENIPEIRSFSLSEQTPSNYMSIRNNICQRLSSIMNRFCLIINDVCYFLLFFFFNHHSSNSNDWKISSFSKKTACRAHNYLYILIKMPRVVSSYYAKFMLEINKELLNSVVKQKS